MNTGNLECTYMFGKDFKCNSKNARPIYLGGQYIGDLCPTHAQYEIDANRQSKTYEKNNLRQK